MRRDLAPEFDRVHMQQQNGPAPMEIEDEPAPLWRPQADRQMPPGGALDVLAEDRADDAQDAGAVQARADVGVQEEERVDVAAVAELIRAEEAAAHAPAQ